MSTEYTMCVKRNSDNKEIAKFMCNEIKTIMDSKYSNIIGCSTYRAEHLDKKITVDLLDSIIDVIKKDIDNMNNEIVKKTLMIINCKNIEVKNDLEDEINDIKENISEYYYILGSCFEIRSKIRLVTEDLFKKNKMAYEYNGSDLTIEKTNPVYIFENDVYADLTSC